MGRGAAPRAFELALAEGGPTRRLVAARTEQGWEPPKRPSRRPTGVDTGAGGTGVTPGPCGPGAAADRVALRAVPGALPSGVPFGTGPWGVLGVAMLSHVP